jgi:hypothetical protein
VPAIDAADTPALAALPCRLRRLDSPGPRHLAADAAGEGVETVDPAAILAKSKFAAIFFK